MHRGDCREKLRQFIITLGIGECQGRASWRGGQENNRGLFGVLRRRMGMNGGDSVVVAFLVSCEKGFAVSRKR